MGSPPTWACPGVIRVDLDGRLAVQRAYGLAHRGLGVPTTVDTQLAIASGTKGLTALTLTIPVAVGGEDGKMPRLSPCRWGIDDRIISA